MTIGKTTARMFIGIWAALLLALAPQAALAQSASVPADATAAQVAAGSGPSSENLEAPDNQSDASSADVAPGSDVYVPMKPTPGKGMPVDGRISLQDQYSPTGE